MSEHTPDNKPNINGPRTVLMPTGEVYFVNTYDELMDLPYTEATENLLNEIAHENGYRDWRHMADAVYPAGSFGVTIRFSPDGEQDAR